MGRSTRGFRLQPQVVLPDRNVRAFDSNSELVDDPAFDGHGGLECEVRGLDVLRERADESVPALGKPAGVHDQGKRTIAGLKTGNAIHTVRSAACTFTGRG